VKQIEKEMIEKQREENKPKRTPNISGIAYGIVNTANNIGLSLFPILFGYINTPPSLESYNKSVLVLIGQCCVGFMFCAAVFVIDMKGKRV